MDLNIFSIYLSNHCLPLNQDRITGVISLRKPKQKPRSPPRGNLHFIWSFTWSHPSGTCPENLQMTELISLSFRAYSTPTKETQTNFFYPKSHYFNHDPYLFTMGSENIPTGKRKALLFSSVLCAPQ